MANYNKTQMYFFKFPNTFFDKDEIEELLSDFDGANTVILYLRLITLATNKEGYLGKLIAGELKPYSVEELSRKTNTEIDDLKDRMTRLKEVGLIELKDNMVFIEEALNYTNQTVGAEKKEKQRKKKKDKDKNKEDNCPLDIEERNNILETRDQSIETINNINNNSLLLGRQEEKTNPALQDICYQVVTYLNNKTFKNFKPGSKKTVDLIKLRLSEGYTLKDFYTVIDKMTHCWLSNGKLEEYLRPITLFGDKFEEPGYSNRCYTQIKSATYQNSCEGRYYNGYCYYGDMKYHINYCDNDSDYKLIINYSDNKYYCYKIIDITRTYECDNGYTLNGTKCLKTETINASVK